jgi:hypothetical protein
MMSLRAVCSRFEPEDGQIFEIFEALKLGKALNWWGLFGCVPD